MSSPPIADAYVQDENAFRSYPGARAPDRQGVVNANGVKLATYEWGDPDAPDRKSVV